LNKLTYLGIALITVIVVTIFRFDLANTLKSTRLTSSLSPLELAESGWIKGCSSKIAEAYRTSSDVVDNSAVVDQTANMICQCYWDHMRNEGKVTIEDIRDNDPNDSSSRVSMAYSRAQDACYEKYKDVNYLMVRR